MKYIARHFVLPSEWRAALEWNKGGEMREVMKAPFFAFMAEMERQGFDYVTYTGIPTETEFHNAYDVGITGPQWCVEYIFARPASESERVFGY